ncbi:MAG: hypothetical protein IJP92_07545, partial [Lachnospiraceae bacterium]|nr:hypothetical protein [Lachnospiraceae bacterium]
MKQFFSVYLLFCILLCGCAPAQEAGDASSLRTDASSAQTQAAAEPAEKEERVVSDLSAEITLQIADAPPSLSDVNAWDEILAPFYEAWPEVTIHLSDAGTSPLQPGLLVTSPARLFPLEGETPALHDLTPLYTPETFSALLPNAVSACMADDGHYYAYPFCVRVSCMAVNRRLLEKTGAMQYINEETRSWSTADFLLAVQTLSDAGYETVLSLPCAEGTDGTATRGLLLNLFGGSFAAPARTGYEVRSENNYHTFETLAEHEGIVFAPEETEASARAAFLDGEVPMLCGWDYPNQMAIADEPDT